MSDGYLAHVDDVIEGRVVTGFHLAGTPLTGRDMSPQERDKERALRREKSRRRRADLATQRRHALTYLDDDEPTQEDPARIREAFTVVSAMYDMIGHVARAKCHHAERLAASMRNAGGTMVDDIHSDTAIAVAESIAKTEDYTIAELETAARFLLRLPVALPRKSDFDPFDESTPRGTLWLHTVMERRCVDVIRRWLTRNPKRDSLDVVDTVIRELRGDDPMRPALRASVDARPPGTAFQQPGTIDQGQLRWLIAEAITEHGLDAVVEVILADEVQLGVAEDGSPIMGPPTTVYGTIHWRKIAPLLWRAAGLPMEKFAKLNDDQRALAARMVIEHHFAHCTCGNDSCDGWLLHGIRHAREQLSAQVVMSIQPDLHKALRQW